MRSLNRLQCLGLVACGAGLVSLGVLWAFEGSVPETLDADPLPTTSSSVPTSLRAEMPVVDESPAAQRLTTEPFSASVEQQSSLSSAHETPALNPGRSVSGWVTSPSGVGIAGARVTLRGLVMVDGGLAPSGARSWATTGPDGAFRTELPRGQSSARVYVDAKLYRLERAVDVNLGTSGVALRMQRLAWLDGRIDFGDLPSSLTKAVKVEVTHQPAILTGRAGSVVSVLVPKPDGHFASAELPEASFDLQFKVRNGAPALHVIEDVQVQSGNQVEDSRLDPVRLAEVVGAVKLKVVDESGQPIRDASIAQPDPNAPDNWPIRGRTKSDGVWEGLFAYDNSRVRILHQRYADTELDLRHGDMNATLYGLHPVEIVLTGITHTGAPYLAVRLRPRHRSGTVVPDYKPFSGSPSVPDWNQPIAQDYPPTSAKVKESPSESSQRFLVPGAGDYEMELELRSAKGPFA